VVQSSQVTPFPADEPLRFERLSVFVRGLEVEAGIGVYDHEQGRLQRLVIDVTLELEPRPIERLGDTINYETVANAARAIAAEGHVGLVEQPDVQGELLLKTPWPSMMRGYLNEDARYRKCFSEGWYFTGDLARRDADGYYWFVGRADDVIKSSGHLIGPFEVESALIEHPAVAEAGVIGVPDPTAGEVVKAFVALKPGFEPSEALMRELLGHARKRLGAAVAPKSIEFRSDLPKTRSGKIMRRLLKARELGLPEGDLSTLESDER